MSYSGCQSSTESASTVTISPPSVTRISPSTASGYSGLFTFQVYGLPYVAGGQLNVYADASCSAQNLALSTAVPVGAVGANFNVSITQAGSYAFSAMVYDNSVGVWSGCSSTYAAYTLLAPPVPSALTLNNPSSNPGYISSPTIQVSGTGIGLTAKVYSDPACSSLVGSGTAVSSSTYVVAVGLPLGSTTLYAQNWNDTGLKSACSTASVVYTYAPPPVPSLLTLINPSSSPGTSAKPTIRVSGIGSGVTANLYTDSSCTTKVASATSYGSTTDLYGSYWTTALANGSYVFYANTNSGSNYSACSSASLAYTLNPLPAPTSLTLVTPSSSPSYYRTPTVSVSGVASGQTVNIYTDPTCAAANQAGSAIVASGTSVNVALTQVLPLGASTLYAAVTDNNYGASNCSMASLAYTVNQRTPYGSYARFGTNYRPNRVVAGDFNGDSKLDLVSANYQSFGWGRLFGNGDGTFAVDSPITGGNYLNAVAVGDLNGDGKLDLVFGEYGTARLEVFLGNGDGTFQGPSYYSITYAGQAGWPEDVALADLNGDGKLDIIVGASFYNYVGVLMGNGDGTFQPIVGYPAPLGFKAMAVADVSGDGRPDVVISTNGGASVYLGNGDGTFQTRVDYAVPGSADGLAIGDVDGNGSPDIVLARGSAGFSVLANLGSGTFGLASNLPIPNGIYSSVAIGDVDGDGIPDVVATDWSNNKVDVHYGSGGGSFNSLPETFPTDSAPVYVILKDLNGNGSLDIVACTSYSNSGLVHGSLSVLKR